MRKTAYSPGTGSNQKSLPSNLDTLSSYPCKNRLEFLHKAKLKGDYVSLVEY